MTTDTAVLARARSLAPLVITGDGDVDLGAVVHLVALLTDPDSVMPLDVGPTFIGATLERCICGRHYACPDGWHQRDDWPCSCTPDCALEEGDDA
jgi:hypothetical protein